MLTTDQIDAIRDQFQPDDMPSRATVQRIAELLAASAPTPSAPTAPAQGEPVAYTSHDRLEKIARNPEHVDTMWGTGRIDEGDMPLYIVPQPAPAVAQPLTEEQINLISEKWSARWSTGSAWNTKRCIDNALREACTLIADSAPTPAAPAVAKEGMTEEGREEFEAWARGEYGECAVVRDGDRYKFTGPDDAWAGWKARALLGAKGE